MHMFVCAYVHKANKAGEQGRRTWHENMAGKHGKGHEKEEHMEKEQENKKDGKQVKRKRTQWVKELEERKQYTNRKGKYKKEGR